MKQPLTEEIKATAESVFIGEAIAYTPRPDFNSKSQPSKPTVIRFKVKKTIAGHNEQQVDVYWRNSVFGESRTFEEFKKSYGKMTRVGITKIGSSPDAGNFNDKPWVVQGSCTSPYMWPEM